MHGSAGAALDARGDGALNGRALVWWRAVVVGAAVALACAAALYTGLNDGSVVARPAWSPVAATRSLEQRGLLSLPLAAQQAVSAAVGRESPAYQVSRSRAGILQAASPAQHLTASFTGTGVSVNSGAAHLHLSLRGLGYGSSLVALGSATPRAQRNRVLYERAGLREWFANGPLGLEQGFTVARAPVGDAVGPLTLAIALAGDARPSLADGGQSVTLSRAGNVALRYGGLTATDARGRVLHSWMTLHGSLLLLHVQAGGARYPLRIDPFVQQGKGLAGAGESVALSEDGNTALIGSGTGSLGAALVFTRSGATWTQQATLMASEGSSEDRFGADVALSADGNTAVIGAAGADGNVGAAFVFTRSGESWTEDQELTAGGEVGKGRLGDSVAVSGDGDTALIGSSVEGGEAGSAWVFTRSGQTWAQQGDKLNAAGEGIIRFGVSVALSDDGSTALIGAPGDSTFAGAAFVFTRSGETWTKAEKLAGGEEVGKASFGESVALSHDGDVALVGGPQDKQKVGAKDEVGAAWVFTRSGETWTQQGHKLVAVDETGSGRFGEGVALSGDGNTALIGAPGEDFESGAAWVFVRSGEGWRQQGARLLPEGHPFRFGRSDALSGEGDTALIGAGEAWPFVSVATPPAEPPEFGRCAKVEKGFGVYGTSACTAPKEGGSYEWSPGVTKDKFTTKSTEPATLETIHGSKVSCAAETGTGAYTTAKAVGAMVLTFTGCERLGEKCASASAGAGEIVTASLEGALGVEKLGKTAASNKIALDLAPTGGGSFAQFTCGATEVSIRGSVLVPVTINKMLLSGKLDFAASKGKQKPESFAGGAKDVLEASFDGGAFEQIGLTSKQTQTSEEEVEVNPVV